MHPANSLIFFTSFSGLGFGLMVFLGMGMPALVGWSAFAIHAVAFVSAGAGLCASTLHLGHPERALKAFTQWRTSWLSREAWLATMALGVNGLHAIFAIFVGTRVAPLGWLGAFLAIATVFATSMIYAQLRTVPRWNHPLTPALFLALSLAGGALLAGMGIAAVVLLCLAGALQILAWRLGDRRFAIAGSTPASATGLEGRGTVRAFEPPHTGASYLTREMVFVLARKRARKLRVFALAAGFALPAILILLAAPPTLLATWSAAPIHLAGLLVLRWLFFAEAEHVVGLYYGKR